MKNPTHTFGVARVGTVALLLAATTALVAATPAAANGRVSDCLDPHTPLSVEENRLSFTLPDNDNPAVLQSKPFAQQMVEGGGLQDFRPQLVRRLCQTTTAGTAMMLVKQEGEQLWQAAVRRAQHKGKVNGSLPYSDDRPLYWTRLQSTAAIRQWKPRFDLPPASRATLITAFDRASRGMFDIDFPAGRSVVRVITSGFDPYTLDGGPAGTAPGATGNNIRHGNPSGATALSIDGTTYQTKDGRTAYIQAYTLPVNYTEFKAGYLEDTVGPFMRPGPRQVDASITVSQAVGSEFWLEQWNGRYHGTYPGNDKSLPCPIVNGVPQLAVNNHGCNSTVVQRWGGPSTFSLTNPPQWTSATLPMAEMIKADTGRSVPRPPGDTWPDTSVAFGVIWHTSYDEFPDCTSPARVTRNNPPPVAFPPPTAPIPPDPGSCSYNGGGGNYLSNESAYRNTLLRDRMGLRIPAGHIHTPDMQHFETPYNPSDATFDAWRQAIAAQTRNLIHAVADSVD
ncbi:hypothetical protein HC028_19010 [Planosporangium flavigriseum]|uniref:Secreted protein n=1 Tax=Planosporangium flavigriseum TaxID=373681 RepID=A0A8J3LLD4_9ACTN|nr:hypothetical protein [Planosporangium flavigriseum]NJC66581.1 hypothetical protein [Planosporangium flavigriseum]GIG73454.1 hypothetical protein Pfl04_18580 [Planosporangium flavigriseum]